MMTSEAPSWWINQGSRIHLGLQIRAAFVSLLILVTRVLILLYDVTISDVLGIEHMTLQA